MKHQYDHYEETMVILMFHVYNSLDLCSFMDMSFTSGVRSSISYSIHLLTVISPRSLDKYVHILVFLPVLRFLSTLSLI